MKNRIMLAAFINRQSEESGRLCPHKVHRLTQGAGA